jgi:hypothetical protein
MEEHIAQSPKEIIQECQRLSDSVKIKRLELEQRIQFFQIQIQGLRNELSELEAKLEYYEMYKVPKIFLMEVDDRSRGKKYVRAVVRFYIEGKRKQQSTTIYLGKLADFPMGLEDLKLKELAEIKAMEAVQRIQSKENSSCIH